MNRRDAPKLAFLSLVPLKSLESKTRNFNTHSPENQYLGEYVAYASFNDQTIVAHSQDPLEACRLADERGYSNAVINYFPPKKTILVPSVFHKI